MKIAVLGPGGVGGLLAGALERAGSDVIVVAREATAAVIAARGLRVQQRHASASSSRARARVARLRGAGRRADRRHQGRRAASRRSSGSRSSPASCCRCSTGSITSRVLRERFAPDSVLAGSIRVEADRPEPGVVVHTSPFLLVSMASGDAAAAPAMRRARATRCRDAGVPVRVLGLRGAGDVVEARAPERARLHDERLRQAARRDPLDAGAARRPRRRDRGGVRGRAGGGRARRRRRRRRSPSSSARTTRSAARCSATSPPGARPSSTRSPDRCCARRAPRHRLPDDRAAGRDDRGAGRCARAHALGLTAGRRRSLRRLAVVAQHLQQLGVGADQVGVVVGRQPRVAARRVLERVASPPRVGSPRPARSPAARASPGRRGRRRR